MKTIEIPEIFKEDPPYQAGEAVNPVSGESICLDEKAMTVYKATIKANLTAERLDEKYFQTLNSDDLSDKAVPYWQKVRAGIDWFKHHYPKEYMVLLD